MVKVGVEGLQAGLRVKSGASLSSVSRGERPPSTRRPENGSGAETAGGLWRPLAESPASHVSRCPTARRRPVPSDRIEPSLPVRVGTRRQGHHLGRLRCRSFRLALRTPRHIIQMTVKLLDPRPHLGETVCDPACGTAGFLVAASEHVRDVMLSDPSPREHYNSGMFHGFDFDATMLRIGSMNMMLHGIEDPDIVARDSNPWPTPTPRTMAPTPSSWPIPRSRERWGDSFEPRCAEDQSKLLPAPSVALETQVRLREEAVPRGEEDHQGGRRSVPEAFGDRLQSLRRAPTPPGSMEQALEMADEAFRKVWALR